MIPWHDLVFEYRALAPFIKASLAIAAVSLAYLGSYHVGETLGVAAFYLFNR